MWFPNIMAALPVARIKKMEQMAAARAVWVHQPLPVTEPQEALTSGIGKGIGLPFGKLT